MARRMTRISCSARGALLPSLLLAAATACSGGAPPTDRVESERPSESLATILAHADGAFRDGNYPEAQSAYEQALGMAPDEPRVIPALGTCYLKNRLTRKAESLLTAHLAKQPGDLASRLVLARVYIRESELDRAAEALRAVLESDPDNLLAHYNLGFVDYRNRKYDEAIVHLERAIALRPGQPEAHYTLGLTLLALGRTGAAIPELERAVAINPKHVGAHFNLVSAYARAGRMKDAERERAIYADLVRKSKSLDERTAQIKAQSVPAIQAMLEKRYQQALAEYQALAVRYPDYAPIYDRIGVLQLRLGRRAEAREALLKAVALDPDLGNPHYVLSNLYREAGDTEAADRELKIFAALETIPEGKSGY
jgi:tetratricopeptide (TPR) repeat protein